MVGKRKEGNVKTNNQFSRYIREKLFTTQDLRRYLESSSVLITGQDSELVMDVMVVMPDDLFEGSFRRQFGECFVVNDHKHRPPVFTRFKSFRWLREDLSRRLPIALWIFRRASVFQDPNMTFQKIIAECEEVFKKTIHSIISHKYIEFRSERHNLRQVVWHKDKIATDLIRATVVKLAFEIVLLSQGSPYPFKKWLSSEVDRLDVDGHGLVCLSRKFLMETDLKRVIALSDQLVEYIIDILSRSDKFSADFLQRWWLYLT